MSNGELHIGIDWGEADKTVITMICSNCHQAIESYASENMFCVPVQIQWNCPKCGARFSKIAGRLE